MPLLVTRREVEGLLDLATAMEVTLAAFKEQAAGAVSTEPPRMLMTRRGALRMVSGAPRPRSCHTAGDRRPGLHWSEPLCHWPRLRPR